jgi:histone deacetylase 1/2
MKDGPFPKSFWPEAMLTAVFILNRLAIRNGKTAYELFTGHEAPFIKLFKYGTAGFVKNLQNESKFADRSTKGYLCGYDTELRGYRMWLPDSGKIVRTADVTFLPESEAKLRVKGTPQPSLTTDGATGLEDAVVDSSGPSTPIVAPTASIEPSEPTAPAEPPTPATAMMPPPAQTPRTPRRAPPRSTATTPSPRKTAPVPRRLEQPILPPNVFYRKDNSPLPSGEANLSVAGPDPDTPTFTEAMAGPHKASWLDAMNDELKAMAENNVWELVDPPNGARLVQTRWVLRIKRKPDRSIDRFRARLVAKGYTQRAGYDYEETFSPVARFDTVRTLMALATLKTMSVQQFDIKTAFLHGVLTETIYMAQPMGFDDQSGRACLLNRSLYASSNLPGVGTKN